MHYCACSSFLPYLGLVRPSRIARLAVKLELALAISEPDSCFQCWDHNTTGGEPENKKDNIS